MKKRFILLIVVVIIVICSLLFSSFYNEAKQEAIGNLNNEQLIHARHAARGIEDFFNYWTNILTSLSESTPIIHMDETAKKNLELLYNANRDRIRAVTRVDAEGRIVYTYPLNPDAIGRNISQQDHVREIMRTHKPVISDVFFAVQGYDTVALHVPVFSNRVYQGTIAVTINFQALSQRYIEDIKIGNTGYAWMTSRNGIELYSPVPGHTGKSILENSKDSPSILAMAKDMLKGRQGSAIYIDDKVRGAKVDLVKKHAVFLPIKLGSTFWTVVVCSSEDEIIASLKNFTNKLILVVCLLLLVGFLFSYYGLKALFIIQEEKKRRRAEMALLESEERYRRIVETSLEGIWILNEERRTTFVNKRIADLLGYAPEEIMGKRLASFMFEEDLEDYALRGDFRRRGVAEVFERRFRRKDGTTIWNIVSSSPLFDGQGRFTGSFAMFTDITERKQAEEAFRMSEQAAKQLAKENELIAEIGRIISSTLEIEEVYQRFADKVREAIPFDRIAINTVNTKDYTRTIQYVQSDIFAGNRQGEVVSLAESGVEQIIRTKSSLLINSKSSEDMRRKLLAAFQFGAQSTMLIPLILKDEVIGSLAVHSAQIDAYSENDLRLAERLASHIAGSIANAQLFRERIQVEEQLQHTLDSLRKSMSATIQVMVSTVEARDPYTAGHQLKSANLARAIATEMGLPQEKIDAIRMAGSIHDIGKISIPAEILSKPTKLSEIEFSLIKEHAHRGFEMLKDVESPWSLAEIVYQHHERIDGSGYPRNLKGEEILIEARILTVADVVEAMASHRPYRPGLGIDSALHEIEKNRGIIYDVAVADACLRLFREKDFKLEGA